MKETYNHLLVDNQGDVCRVTINRPGDRNSIHSGVMDELVRMMDQVEQTAARAIVFTGAGKTYFIGGADGVEMMQCEPEEAKAFSARIQDLFNRMEKSPLILVAAINGLCFGGGFEFAMACDFRIAGEDARIGLPEVKVGIIPGGGGTQRLPRLVGYGLAMEMILSGRLYNGVKACEMGLVHRVSSVDQLMTETEALLKIFLGNPAHALIQAKQAVHASAGESFHDGLKKEREAFGRCFKEDYFTNLMEQQLNSGELKTTTRLP